MTAIVLSVCAIAAAAAPGFPGPECRADYSMDVVLVEDSSLVRGSSMITFTSGMDFNTDTLWIHLYPNAFRDHTTAFGQDLEAIGRYCLRASGESERGWIDLHDWTLDGSPVEIQVDGTLGFVLLPEPLEPGGKAVLEGDFILHVPSFWRRLGHLGDTYQITQWYPKMCVLDRNGWHRGRYRWYGEFYSDYGSYDVTMDVPADFTIAATGAPVEVTVSEDSLRRTEVWHAENVHDFVWASSPDYTVREHTYVYPPELGSCPVDVHLVLLDDDPEHWSDVPAMIDSTLLYYGQWYVPYPYGDLWVVEPAILMAGGMEYPQFIFSGEDIPMTRALEMVTSHEIGHQWFYGILGNDEVDEAWLDEGMNTFSELRYMERRHGFAGNMSKTPSWLMDVSDQDMSLMTYSTWASDEERVPVLSDATAAGDGSHPTGFTYYSKPAFFLRMLMRQVGEEQFDEIMSIYFSRFMYHHPHTEDFQAIVQEVTGRSWQDEFDFWLRGTGSADMWVSGLDCGEHSTVALIQGDFPHDVILDVLFISGEDSVMTEAVLPAGGSVAAEVPGSWDMAVADPYLMIPDRSPWNNSMPVRSQLRPLLFPVPRPSHYSFWILPFPSYAAGSWRAELLMMSAPITSFMGGPYTWTASTSIPFQSDGYSAWGTFYHAPVFRKYRRSLYFSMGLERGYGTGSVSAGLDYGLRGRVATDPRVGLSFGAEYFSVEDTSVYGSSNVDQGNGFEFSAGVSASDQGYAFSWETSLETLFSPGWNEGSYSRTDLEVDVTTRLAGENLARTRIYAGRVTGDAPTHVLLRPGGGLFAGGIMGSFIPPDGSLSPLEHYYIRSGPALPGYWENSVRGRASLTFEQRLPMPLFPMEIYAAGGWIADGFKDFSSETFLSEAGFAFRFIVLEGIFPIWVSDPQPGDDNWEFRWRIGISPAGFIDLY